jgi:hypothetical protein
VDKNKKKNRNVFYRILLFLPPLPVKIKRQEDRKKREEYDKTVNGDIYTPQRHCKVILKYNKQPQRFKSYLAVEK